MEGQRIKSREPMYVLSAFKISAAHSVTTDERLAHRKHPLVPSRTWQHLSTACQHRCVLPAALARHPGLFMALLSKPSSSEAVSHCVFNTFALTTLTQKRVTYVCPHQFTV